MQSSRLSRAVVALGAAATISLGAAPKPAAASTADTTRTLLYAAAAVGAIVLYNNYQHKRQAANTVVGYTQNGGTVYGDGRVVMPNGATYYPNQGGNYAWGAPAYYNQRANYYAGYYGGVRHDNGLHRGWYKHGGGDEHGHGHHDHGDRGHHDRG
ncbi:MAG TPA: hypothetical protein VGN14_16745 [Candidatus Elarobacter sp.]|jgi:hypothetical protein